MIETHGALDVITLAASVLWWMIMLDVTCVKFTGYPVSHWRDNFLDKYGF